MKTAEWLLIRILTAQQKKRGKLPGVVLACALACMVLDVACGGASGGGGGGGNPGETFTYSVLHSFTGQPDGGHPFAGLVLDKAGNLYGTTSSGGTSDGGTVFKLDPTGKETVLYNFTGGADGGYPSQGELILDAAGNLYGTAGMGGSGGFGVVFKLDSAGAETVLYNFTAGPDGGWPHAGVVRDAAGNLYGTAQTGGDLTCGFGFGCGVVFKVDANGNETVLHDFEGGADGVSPFGNLVLDTAGNLYGTTTAGGASNEGVVFKVDPIGTETVLHTFTGPDGGGSTGRLVRDAAGNLYGTTSGGGASKQGTVFKVDPSGKETVLYSFTGGTDGTAPITGLALDTEGDLYGTTDSGGNSPNCFFGCGVVFKVDPTGKETVLHNFTGTDGAQGLDVIRDAAGNLYGTTLEGGVSGCDVVFTTDCGVVFKLTRSH